MFSTHLEVIRNWRLILRSVGEEDPTEDTTVWMNFRRLSKKNFFAKIFIFHILATNNKATFKSWRRQTYLTIHCPDPLGKIFSQHCSKSTQILSWCPKRHRENYDIKSFEKESGARRKKRPLRSLGENYAGISAQKLSKPRKKRLLRNFPDSLHFKKGKEPRGTRQELNTGGFWKQILMFSNL